MRQFSPELEQLLAVAAATVDRDGTLIRANAGFLRLVHLEGPPPSGTRVAQYFIQPSFAALVGAPAKADGEIHRGLVTIGDFHGRTQSLRALIWRDDAGLDLLAEYDIADLERLNQTVLALNRDYAAAQLELAQSNLRMKQLNTLLSEQKAELETSLNRIRRLEGVLPICMYCKKIRAERDDWQQLERYISEHSDAAFSHGMCPSCDAEQRKLLDVP